MLSQLSAITAEQFTSKVWKRRISYASAAQINLLKVVAAKLAGLVPTLPLRFVKAGDSFQLVAIASLQPEISNSERY